MNTVKNRFEKLKKPKNKHKKKVAYDNCKQLYYYFLDIYNKWQINDDDDFPNLMFIHSMKRMDELDLRQKKE